MRKLAIVIALLLWAAPAGAYTTSEWWEDYHSASPTAREGAAMFFYGTLQGLQANEMFFMRKTIPGFKVYCGKQGTMGQAEQEFLQYLRETERGWRGSGLTASSAIFSFHRDKSNCGGPSY